MEEKTCPKCSKINVPDANFCEYCGKKLSNVCPRCWKKQGQPNSCPNERCT